MKKYYIRQVGFVYDDEGNSKVEGFGGLENTFDNFEDAEKEIRRLTLKKWIGVNPFNYSGYTFEEISGLNSFAHKEFGFGLLWPADEKGDTELIKSFRFPKDLTEEQAWKIREISRIHHFEIIEHTDEEPPFWGFRLGVGMKDEGKWLTRDAFKVDENNQPKEHGKIPTFLTTRDEALEYLRWMTILPYFCPIGIIGTFEELSDTPQILKSIVEQDARIEYYENANRLILSRLYDNEKLLAINSLLKEKFIKVAPIPIEELIALGGEWIPFQ